MAPDRVLAFDRILSSVLILAAITATLLLNDSYLLRLLAVAGCYAILTIGYQRIFGELGVLSLAQGAFFAIGGYATAIIGSTGGWDGLVLLPIAILLAMLLALIVAPPMLRLASHYFALASLAVAQLVLLAAINLESITGGANGLSALPALRIGGVTITQGWSLTLAIWILAALCGIAFWLPGSLAVLRRHVLRDAPLAAQAAGLNAARWSIRAFAFSAACAGLAGGLYVQATGVAAPDLAEFAIMVNVLAMSVIGGRGRVAGAIIGALILAFLPEALRFLGGWQLFAWGAAMLLMLIIAPGGIAGLLEKLMPPTPVTIPNAIPPSSHRRRATLQTTGLRKAFGGVVAVDDISLTVEPQQIVGIIGANGAGKTTLLNLLSGFLQPDAGNIRWRNVDIAEQPPHRRAQLGIGRSFQTVQLPDGIPVLDAIAFATPQTRNLAVARGEAMEVVQRLSLSEYAATPLSDLSPAIRRMVDIARALAAKPSLLLLDEPTSGLSIRERETLAKTLRLLRDEGLGLVLVEHDIEFVLSLADRLVCLDQGRVVADDTGPRLRARADLRGFFGRRTTP